MFVISLNRKGMLSSDHSRDRNHERRGSLLALMARSLAHTKILECFPLFYDLYKKDTSSGYELVFTAAFNCCLLL